HFVFNNLADGCRRALNEPAMLRITIHDQDAAWRMQLEGKLVGAWVDETETVWRSAPESGKAIEIDLTDVTAVDDEGRRLLNAMRKAGAHLLASGVEMKHLVSGISKLRLRGGILRHLLCLVLLAVTLRAEGTPPPMRLTLKQAVALALKQNPQVA